MSKILSFAEAIHEAMHEAMAFDENVITYGLGVNDPKSIFDTTKGLESKFGSNRVFDMPTSENAMTGVAIGAALNGIRVVMVHQRLDFFLLAMDQLVNNAAKWHYMFGANNRVPITIRLILGRGWGQGPTHSQSLHAWFAHIPGLKVVIPTSVADAKGLLLSSIFDNNPVLFLEHRWLYNLKGEIPSSSYRVPIGKALKIRSGILCTVVSMSYMTIEAIHAIDFLAECGFKCDLIDLRTVRPIDWDTIFKSVQETGRLLVLDTGHTTGSVAGEIIAKVSIECWSHLRSAPQRIAMPDYPEGSSPALTERYHPNSKDIINMISKILEIDISMTLFKPRKGPHDIPGDWFNGPF